MRKVLIFGLIIVSLGIYFSRAYWPGKTFAQTTTCSAGINAFIWCKKTVDNLSSEATVWKDHLQNEIKKMVVSTDANPHLRPFRAYFGEGEPVYVWGNPADNIYSLARAYPYIADSSIKSELIAYVQNELTNYSPLSLGFAPSTEGRSRNGALSSSSLRAVSQVSSPTLWNLYAIWLFAANLEKDGNLEGWNWISNHWSTNPGIVSFFNGKTNSSLSTYEDIAGALAFARMAYRQEGNSCGEKCTKGVNAATAGFTAGGNFTNFHAASLARYDQSDIWENVSWPVPYLPIGSNRDGQGGDPRGVPVIFHLEPEIGRFLAANSSLKTQVQTKIDNVERAVPIYFVNHAPFFYDSPNLTDDGFFYYTESAYQFPGYFNWIIPAKAWVFNASSSSLEPLIDGPWSPVGDLDYINNLVILIESFGSQKWCNVKNTSDCYSGT